MKLAYQIKLGISRKELFFQAKLRCHFDIVGKISFHRHFNFDFVTSLQDCQNSKALGMENHNISDDQITASSEWHDINRAAHGRLNFIPDRKGGAWSSRPNDLNQWLQVDFQRCTIITGISTQGRYEQSQYVKRYTISFGDDKKQFHVYKVNEIVKVR